MKLDILHLDILVFPFLLLSDVLLGVAQKYMYQHVKGFVTDDIIHISHGFEGDIPEYQPPGDTKALARYVTRCRRQRVT